MRCRDFLILLALASATACATATPGGPEAPAHLEQVHRAALDPVASLTGSADLTGFRAMLAIRLGS